MRAVLVLSVVWLLLLVAVGAYGQEPATLDPQIVALLTEISKQQSIPWAQLLGDSSPIVAVVLGVLGLRNVAPQIGGRREEDSATLARIDERTRETRREVRRLRETVHWHGNCLQALASDRRVDLPTKPPPDDEEDSDGPQ